MKRDSTLHQGELPTIAKSHNGVGSACNIVCGLTTPTPPSPSFDGASKRYKCCEVPCWEIKCWLGGLTYISECQSCGTWVVRNRLE
jgi:hypothetical protein